MTVALPGNPVVVEAQSAALLTQAELIQRAADELLALTFGGTARALDAVRERSAETAHELSTAHARYEGTGQALSTYGVELKAAHEEADRADEEQSVAARQIVHYADVARTLEAHIRALTGDPAMRSHVDALADELHAVQRAIAAHSATHEDARKRHTRAFQRMNDAAERARSLIAAVLTNSNEGVWDRVLNVVSTTGTVLANIRDWAERFLAHVWASVKRVKETMSALLVTALVLVALVKVAAAVSAILGIVAATAVTLLATFIIASILSDVMKPTPRVSRKDVDDRIRRRMTTPTGLEEVLAEAAEVDSLPRRARRDRSFLDRAGSPVETVVKVTRVVDTDGIVRWRVVLPSTQEWLTWANGHDGGAVNDLDSNLALMLTPAVRTQVERAVLAAMEQAGIGENDPVMLVGFSQGGMLSGHLASYNTSYNWDVVVVAGAPIDHMPIPGDVRVVSIQHDGDPVHRLDTAVGGPRHGQQKDHWVTIRDSVPNSRGVGDTHNVDRYQHTMAKPEHIERIMSVLDDTFEHYFHTEEGTYGSATEYYRWNE